MKLEKMKSLANQIINDNNQLHSYFQENDFVSMARLHEELKATFVTPEYNKIWGKDIEAFWKRARQEGAKLEFKTVNICLSEAIGVKKAKEKTYDTVAFVLQEIHILSKKEESALHNATLLESRNYLHQDQCPWF